MKRIRVLVIDDSAFARKVIREVLSQDPEIEVVGIARDGLEGLEKIAELRPDVITLDLVMPDLDGLGLLRALPTEAPPRVVVVSSSASDSELAVEALQRGAVELVHKPTSLATDRLYDLSNDLRRSVKAASAATSRLPTRARDTSLLQTRFVLPEEKTSPIRLLVIGTSTGGPQALTQLLSALPSDLPVAIAIALHIPAGYTAPLAARISRANGVIVEEAYNGMEVKSGQAVLAPGGLHLRMSQHQGRLTAVTTALPHETLHHPSVDVLFESAAQQFGSGVLGVILTGMGDDGLLGSKAIRAAGGSVLAESASSCVVYGMPRSVIEAGVANAEAPLDDMPALILQHIFAMALKEP